MQDLRICLVQVDQSWENIPKNLEKFEHWIQKCKGADLIILPEMFHTSFSMNITLAEDWVDNSMLKKLKDWSAQMNTAIYTSMMVKDQGCFFNRGVFVQPNGRVDTYDKRQSFGLGGEDKVFTSGIAEKIISFNGWKINLQICYDLRFPELIRNRIDEQGHPAYDVLLYVANWPKKRITHWSTLLQARAIENQCYVIGVNRIGIDGNQLEYCGSSAIYDALGNQKLSMSDMEGVSEFTLSSADLQEIRMNLPFLKDRK